MYSTTNLMPNLGQLRPEDERILRQMIEVYGAERLSRRVERLAAERPTLEPLGSPQYRPQWVMR